MFLKWQIVREFFEARPAGPRGQMARGMRLRVEELETRLVPSGVDVVPGHPKHWHNPAETRLRPGNVGGLHVLGSFPTAGPVSGTPAAIDGVADAASRPFS